MWINTLTHSQAPRISRTAAVDGGKPGKRDEVEANRRGRGMEAFPPEVHVTIVNAPPPMPPPIPPQPKGPFDLDGDLLIEEPFRDRIADVPMVQLTNQRITVGITPELSGSTTKHRSSDFEATLQLKDTYSMQFSGLLSIEGGFNLGLGNTSSFSSGTDGKSSSAGGNSSQGFNAAGSSKQSLEYSMRSEVERLRVAKELARVEQSQEVTIGPKAGYISIQFTVQNTGSQAVVLRDPSFAVSATAVGADGATRTMTVVPEQSIEAAQVTDPWLRAQALGLTLAPGESRTISLRLVGQDTSTIVEMLKHSRAAWASLHFGKQVAITDATIAPDGKVTPGEERDISRDLVSRIRKRTIPFHFQPPRSGASIFGQPRTTLIAALPRKVDHLPVDGTRDDGPPLPRQSTRQASLRELFHFHGGIPTDLNATVAVNVPNGPAWVIRKVGPLQSSLATGTSLATLATLSPNERAELGRWELQVFHRDFGAVAIDRLDLAALTPDHQVVLRWVTGEVLFERAKEEVGVKQARMTIPAGHVNPLPAPPGSEVTIQISGLHFTKPLEIEAPRYGQRKWNGQRMVIFQKRQLGQDFAYDRLSPQLRQRLEIRYAYVSKRHATEGTRLDHLPQVAWKIATLDAHGKVILRTPTSMEVPDDAVLVITARPFTHTRRDGLYYQDRYNRIRPSFFAGRLIKDQLPIDLHIKADVLPATPPSSSNGPIA